MASSRIVMLGRDSLESVGRAICLGMEEILGKSGVQSAMYHTGFDVSGDVDFAINFEELLMSLREMFGQGATRIEKQIARSLYRNVCDVRALKSFLNEYSAYSDSLALIKHEVYEQQLS